MKLKVVNVDHGIGANDTIFRKTTSWACYIKIYHNNFDTSGNVKKISCYMQNILLIVTLGQMITLNEKRKT